MHYLIKLLVQAETAEEALGQAELDAGTMVEYGYIDWYDMNGRWGTSEAHSLESEKGKELLEEGMKCNREEFDGAMEAIRYMMENFSDEEIYNEEFKKDDKQSVDFYLSKYQFSIAAGKTNAAAVYAMDGELWGSRINSDKELKRALEGIEDDKLWVVPVDVHN